MLRLFFIIIVVVVAVVDFVVLVLLIAIIAHLEIIVSTNGYYCCSFCCFCYYSVFTIGLWCMLPQFKKIIKKRGNNSVLFVCFTTFFVEINIKRRKRNYYTKLNYHLLNKLKKKTKKKNKK